LPLRGLRPSGNLFWSATNPRRRFDPGQAAGTCPEHLVPLIVQNLATQQFQVVAMPKCLKNGRRKRRPHISLVRPVRRSGRKRFYIAHCKLIIRFDLSLLRWKVVNDRLKDKPRTGSKQHSVSAQRLLPVLKVIPEERAGMSPRSAPQSCVEPASCRRTKISNRSSATRTEFLRAEILEDQQVDARQPLDEVATRQTASAWATSAAKSNVLRTSARRPARIEPTARAATAANVPDILQLEPLVAAPPTVADGSGTPPPCEAIAPTGLAPATRD
jgi:hypothetical protein